MKKTIFLFLLRILRMLITVITVPVSAHYFGVSMERDMWVLVLALTTNILMAVWGPLNEVFRTKFIFLAEQEGKEVAIRKSASLVGFVFCGTIFLIVLLTLFSETITSFIVDESIIGSYDTFLKLFLLLLPSMLINQITNIGICILNAFEVYYLPEITGVFTGLLNILFLVFLTPFLGIYTLVISTYIGISALLFVILYHLRKKRICIWTNILNFRWHEVKIFLVFALPFFFPYFVGQVNGFGEKYLSSLMGNGMVSTLDYSRQFSTIMQSVLSSVLTTIMVPTLAKEFINQRMDSFVGIIKQNLSTSFLISAIALGFMCGATEPLCDYFFNRGMVTDDTLKIIENLVRCFGVSFLGILMYLIFGMSLLASGKTKAYATIGVATQIIVLATNISLYTIVGVYVFPITTGIIHFCSGLTMLFLLKIEKRKQLLIYYLQSVFFVLLFVFILALVNKYISRNTSLLSLVLNGICIASFLPILATALGLNVKRFIKEKTSKLWKEKRI